MSNEDCIACDGEGGHPETGRCSRCKGTGDEPAEMIQPEEPPPHTDDDAPHDIEPSTFYCPVCLREEPRCTCEDEVDENALREALGRL